MNEVIEILKRVGGLITEGHFVYISGKHGSVYINKDAIYPHTAEASRIGELFAKQYKDKGVEIVVGPALGGIILSQWTAHHLSRLCGREVLAVYTEKTPENNQVFTRGYGRLVAGKKILIVEDTTTTGSSVKKVIEAVRAAGGEVLAVGVIVNRDPQNINSEAIGVSYSALLDFPAEAFEETDCPLCKTNVPINTDVGHGKKFLAQKRKRGKSL